MPTGSTSRLRRYGLLIAAAATGTVSLHAQETMVPTVRPEAVGLDPILLELVIAGTSALDARNPGNVKQFQGIFRIIDQFVLPSAAH